LFPSSHPVRYLCVQFALGAVDVDGEGAGLVDLVAPVLQAVDGELAGVADVRRDADGEGRLGYVLVVELDGHLVLARLRAHVRDAARAVPAVVEVDLGLGGALDGDGEGARARFPRVDVELVGLVDFAAHQAHAARSHLVRA